MLKNLLILLLGLALFVTLSAYGYEMQGRPLDSMFVSCLGE